MHILTKIVYLFFLSAIVCSSLNLDVNGFIEYTPDSVEPFDFLTTATYYCNEGFFLEGNNISECREGGASITGEWTGSAPSCSG